MKNQFLYRQQADLHLQLPLFYQPWWLDIVSENWDVAMTDETGITTAVFPFSFERKAGVKLLRNPPLCPYLGPYFLFKEPSDLRQWKREEETLEKLCRQIPKWDYFQFTTLPGYQNFLPFHERGFSNTNKLTYTIDLSAAEQDIFGNFQSRLKSYIRNAEKQLIISSEVPKDLSQFLSWHQHSFSKKGRAYPFNLKIIKHIISRAEQQQSSIFQTAFDKQGQPTAMLWTPFDQKTGYHLLAATNPQYKINGALALLVWEAIKRLKQKGIAFYDFEGSMDKGIEQFFRKFGGKRIPYLFFEQNNSMLWKVKKRLLG